MVLGFRKNLAFVVLEPGLSLRNAIESQAARRKRDKCHIARRADSFATFQPKNARFAHHKPWAWLDWQQGQQVVVVEAGTVEERSFVILVLNISIWRLNSDRVSCELISCECSD